MIVPIIYWYLNHILVHWMQELIPSWHLREIDTFSREAIVIFFLPVEKGSKRKEGKKRKSQKLFSLKKKTTPKKWQN